jgi:hypothetical protein
MSETQSSPALGARRTLEDGRIVERQMLETGEQADVVVFNPVPEQVKGFIDSMGYDGDPSTLSHPMSAMQMGRDQNPNRAHHEALYTDTVEVAHRAAGAALAGAYDEFYTNGVGTLDGPAHESYQNASRAHGVTQGALIAREEEARRDFRSGVDRHEEVNAEDRAAVAALGPVHVNGERVFPPEFPSQPPVNHDQAQ